MQNEAKLPEGVNAVENNKQNHFKSSLVLFDKPSTTRIRSFAKNRDGCDGFCTYCQIPYAQVFPGCPCESFWIKPKLLVEDGTSEIILTGIHIGDYGEDFGHPDALAELIEGMLQKIPRCSIEISSLEPRELSPKLISAFVEHKELICDHFHLPLQSG